MCRSHSLGPVQVALVVCQCRRRAGRCYAVSLLGGFAAFLFLTVVTICAGHSVGMHRLLIHRSFKAARPLEYLLVWLGVPRSSRGVT